MVKDHTKIELEKMKEAGFALLGDFFKDTLAFVQIERKLKELDQPGDQLDG